MPDQSQIPFSLYNYGKVVKIGNVLIYERFFRDFKDDKVMSGGFVVTFITIFLTFIYILINLQFFPPYIPLFNQLPWGDQRLGTTFTIFIPLGITALIAVLNIVICSFIYKNPK